MTLNEASERFRIDIERLKFYEDNGLLRCKKIVNGTPNYTENELRKVGIIHSLEKAGFNVQMIRQYMTLGGGQKEEKIRLLRKQRCRLLEEIHGKQQSLDELDYMIREIKKETF
ncbi:MAG: MerR family transcriptional regulator [Ruminococcus sp.]|nr:MerR family transcriptional regulator [Ruminococcus sp.]